MVVFRPFVGEVLEGRVRSCSQEGIRITMGFFDDVLVPPSCLQANTLFDPTEQVWAWHYEDTKMFIDVGETIRFRVSGEKFEEAPPLAKEALMAPRTAGGEAVALPASNMEGDVGTKQFAPYRLVGSIAEDGLGLARWWRSGVAEEGKMIE